MIILLLLACVDQTDAEFCDRTCGQVGAQRSSAQRNGAGFVCVCVFPEGRPTALPSIKPEAECNPN